MTPDYENRCAALTSLLYQAVLQGEIARRAVRAAAPLYCDEDRQIGTALARIDQVILTAQKGLDDFGTLTARPGILDEASGTIRHDVVVPFPPIFRRPPPTAGRPL